jgi:hypothetical protein
MQANRKIRSFVDGLLGEPPVQIPRPTPPARTGCEKSPPNSGLPKTVAVVTASNVAGLGRTVRREPPDGRAGAAYRWADSVRTIIGVRPTMDTVGISGVSQLQGQPQQRRTLCPEYALDHS